MYKKFIAACSVLALAMLGIIGGAAPATAAGGGHYCFFYPDGTPYLGPTWVEVNVANNDYDFQPVPGMSGTTTPGTGCYSFTFPHEALYNVYVRGVAGQVDYAGRQWYGVTYVAGPGLDLVNFGNYYVLCYSGC